MTFTFSSALLQAIIALIAGCLIFIRPEMLSYIVALFLIITGVLGIAKETGAF